MLSFLAFTLAVVATASTNQEANLLQARQSFINTFHISKSYIGCGLPFPNTCSFEITIDSDESFDIPGVNAHCYRRIPAEDNDFFPCDLTGETSFIPGRQVTGVFAKAFLDPAIQQYSRVYVAVQLFNARTQQLETWIGQREGIYLEFSQGLSEYDLTPQQAPGLF